MADDKGDEERERSIEDFLRDRAEIDRAIREKFEREVTVMFTDIVASSTFFETHGDLQGRSMVQRHNDLLHPIIAKHGGRVLKPLGDGLMISFETPSAAARAAVEIQTALGRENHGKRPVDQIWVKAAIHCGLGIVEKEDVYGDVVNTTARICSLAKKGDILVSQACIEAIRGEGDILHDYVGMKPLRGKSAPMDIHRILWDPAQDTDLRRSIGEEEKGITAGDAVLRLTLVQAEERIRVTAHLEAGQAQAAKYSQEYAYAGSDVRSLVDQIDHCLASVGPRGRLTGDNLAILEGLCGNLHEILMPESLCRFIADNPAHTLILQADSPMMYIPWELLHDGKDFFCLKYNMGRLVSPTSNAVASGRELNHRPLKMLVVTDPRGDLAATKSEGIAIQKELNKDSGSTGLSVSLHGRDTSREFLRSHLADFDLFHYAGHSDYDPRDPSSSGLLLADGKFEVGHFLGLAKERPLPSLVFTNGCRSGLTRARTAGEYLHDMAGAFLLTGVRHYIGSTVDLFDRSSAAFAEEFYRRLARNQPVGEAMRRARLKAISRYGNETITWASYVLYGDPTFRYIPKGEAVHAPTRPAMKLSPRMAAAAGGLLIILLLAAVFVQRLHVERSRVASTVNQGFNLIHTGQVSQAEELFRTIEGKGTVFYRGMSAVYLSRGDMDKALDALKVARKENGGSPYDSVLSAHLAFSGGNLEESEAAYRGALALEGMETWQKAECHFGLGRVFAGRGSWNEAVEQFTQALSLDPSFIQAYTAKGLALERLGQSRGALNDFEKAASINPEDAVNGALYQRCRERLAETATAERRARVDTLVGELLKSYDERQKNAATDQDEWTSKPLYVFFLDLEGKGRPAPREGEDAFLSERIIQQVTDSSRFLLVERALLDKVMEELKLGSTQLADSRTALRLGKILSARILATGSILRYKSGLEITLRAIDTETTRVAATASGSCQMAEDPANMLRSLVQDFKAKVDSAYPVRGRVTEVGAGEVGVNIGTMVGISPGMKLRVVDKEGKGQELVVQEAYDQSSTASPVRADITVETGWRVEKM